MTDECIESRALRRLVSHAICGLLIPFAVEPAVAADPAVPAASVPATSTRPVAWGTYERPFAADSLWNSRPVKPVLGDFVIQKSDYFPAVAEGPWSSGVFLAKPGDPPMRVRGQGSKAGVWDPDAEEEREVVIPHWPADIAPATQSDGHADIVDPAAGVIHSFWQLRKVDGQWTAAQHGWSSLTGSGWGDPAHYFQGARAAGVPTAGGLIRKQELDDGAELFQHALAVSLTDASLSANPPYVFPATSADADGASRNKGKIPEGALLMLPADFDVGQLSTPILRKVARTLKTYGARVVDRNDGTPYNIYVELGSGFNLHKRGWNSPAANELEAIRTALRPVLSTEGWMDGNGKAFQPEQRLNVLSMRGPWKLESGSTAGVFDTLRQAVVFPPSATPSVQVNDSGRGLNGVTWAVPVASKPYRITSATSGGAKLRIVLKDRSDGRIAFDSGALANGESRVFPWPANCAFIAYAISGTGQPSSVSGFLVGSERVPP